MSKGWASMQWGQRIGGIILQAKAEYQYDFIVNVRKSHWKVINKRVILQAIFLKYYFYPIVEKTELLRYKMKNYSGCYGSSPNEK